jgi:2-methylcitrate dehydratase PrpD
MTNKPATLAQGLFEFSLDYPTSDLPATAERAASQRAVDTVAAALAGASMGMGTAASEIVLSEIAEGRSSIWASGGVTRPAALASFANGMLSHGMDYDDTQTRATMHPGIVIVPTALAVGEEVGASGPDVLAAIAIGYEIATRLGELTPGAFQRQGFHPSSVLGIFGATAVAARLMGVTVEQAVNAAGLAGSMAAGLMEYLTDGSDAKQMHPGWVAQGAIRAVQLAVHGGTGPASVLDGPKGVFRAFVGKDVNVTAGLAGLGESWEGLAVATKPYAACHCVHAPVDAWRKIRDTHGLTAEDTPRITRLIGLVPSWYLQLVCDPIEEKRHPRSVYEARFSLPYALARVVIDGELTLDTFTSDKLDDPAVLELSDKVDYQVVEYEEFPEAFPGGLRVEMDDGRLFETDIRHNVGSVGNPMTDDQINTKLLDAAQRLSGTENAGQDLLQSLLQLTEAGSDLRGFTEAMARFHRVSVAAT